MNSMFIMLAALFGLVVPAFANKVFLPRALSAQKASGRADQALENVTRIVYRFVMPIFLPVVFALCAYFALEGQSQ